MSNMEHIYMQVEHSKGGGKMPKGHEWRKQASLDTM